MSDDEYAPVYYGNTLKPTHAKSPPEVSFDANKKLIANQVRKRVLFTQTELSFHYYFFSFISNQADGNTLWTLILTNPDGHFIENDKEYLHWFV